MISPRILVKMACHNEAENLPLVLSRMPPGVDVLVIDDGSTDGTMDAAERGGAVVLRHPIRMGQGIADQTGFLWALQNGHAIVVEMDGDGQHDPSDIPRFVRQLTENPKVDFVTGSRILGTSFPEHEALRRIFLPWYTKLINAITGYRMTDSMCGYKAYRMDSIRRVIDDLCSIREAQYSAAEMFIRFSQAGMKMCEIPIHISKRHSGISRKGTIRYGIGVLRAIVRTSLALARRGKA